MYILAHAPIKSTLALKDPQAKVHILLVIPLSSMWLYLLSNCPQESSPLLDQCLAEGNASNCLHIVRFKVISDGTAEGNHSEFILHLSPWSDKSDKHMRAPTYTCQEPRLIKKNLILHCMHVIYVPKLAIYWKINDCFRSGIHSTFHSQNVLSFKA